MVSKFSRFAVLVVCALWITAKAHSQCIVINEVMVNAAGPFDGASAPNTSEWIELYNTCNTPVNIGCFVISDGDFTVTIPAGTTLAPNGYYTIGSSNSGIAINLNWATCGCTTGGTQVGIFTNSNEQIVLVNSSGAVQDAIYWGSGQFPVNNTSLGGNGCSAQSINYPNNTGFTMVPSSGSSASDGCTVARTCDGSSSWATMCGNLVTPGASNNSATPTVAFTASSTTICPGECINFTNTNPQGLISSSWQFTGASTTSSTDTNPQQICYPNIGAYNVTLTVQTECGTANTTLTNYISVQNNLNPQIEIDGDDLICEGEAVLLTTTAQGAYQWLLGGNPIANANAATYNAGVAGNYSLQVTSGSCTGVSNTISISQSPVPSLNIIQGSTLEICAGASATLSTQPGFATYQWFLNDDPISGATQVNFVANVMGTYYVVATNAAGCAGISNELQLSQVSFPLPTISSSSGSFTICDGQEITLSVPNNYSAYQWTLNGNNLGGATSSSITVGNNGTYAVVLTQNGCNAPTSNALVNVQSLPTLTINPSGSISTCQSSQVLNGTSSVNNFQWYLNNTLITGATASSYTATQAGTYYFTSQSTGQCTEQSDQVVVTFTPGPTVAINASNTNPCVGETVNLSISGNYDNISWSNGQQGNAITVSTGGTYTVTVTTAGCTATDNINLTFSPLPTATISPGGNISTCLNPYTLTATTNGNVSWYYNGQPQAGAQGNSFAASGAGSYYFVATTSSGCTATSNVVNLTFVDGIEVTISASATRVCVGETITLSVAPGYDQVLWSTSQTGNSIVLSSGDLIEVFVTDNGCTGSDFIQLTFDPIPIVNAGNDTISDCDLGVLLTGTGTGELSWQSDPTLASPETAITLASPVTTTTYTLIGKLGNCTATDQVVVEADCTSLFVPNVFTPNGDGKNDYFKVLVRGAQQFELKIYNRWGNIVFETTNPNDVWTGGKGDYYVPDGTYYWTVLALDANNKPIGKSELNSGTVTILR